MISFWVPAAEAFAIEEFIAQRAPELGERLRVCPYESLAETVRVTRGAHLFTALDQLGPGGRETVTALYDQIRERCPGSLVLNDPRRVLGRYDLLAAMHRAGINEHQARRAREPLEGARYPVFIREETGHDGALTGLLGNPKDVARALRSLRFRGHRADNLLVVEFADVSDAGGVYRMAAAIRIGERIIPSFLIRGTEWMLKWGQCDKSEAALRELLDNLERNPHEAWVRRICEQAGVEYGRLDYGIRGETLRVWEINVNPTVGPGRGPKPAPLAPEAEAIWARARVLYARTITDAFTALDPDSERGEVEVRLPVAAAARARSELAAGRQRAARLGVMRRLYAHPVFGMPFRALYSWLLPRP